MSTETTTVGTTGSEGEVADRPRRDVAPDTHPLELRRLALEEAQHPACDPLSVQLLLWLVRTSSTVLTTQADALRPLDLSTSAFNVLMTLRNTPGGVLEPCDIADRLLVTRPSVTGLLDTLEAKGLIERGAHPADRRRRLVHLTPAAHDLCTRHLDDHYAEVEELFAALTREERASLVVLLRRVVGPHAARFLPDDEAEALDATTPTAPAAPAATDSTDPTGGGATAEGTAPAHG